MAAQKRLKGILLLSKEKADCYIQDRTQIFSLTFSPNIVRSMEVVDTNSLINSVKTFVQTNKIPPTDFLLIMHQSILFEKTIVSDTLPQTTALQNQTTGNQSSFQQQQPTQPSEQLPQTPHVVSVKYGKATAHDEESEEKKIERFVDTVPFDEVLVTIRKFPQGKEVFAVNKQLVIELKEAFALAGCTIESGYPAPLFGKESGLEAGFTAAIASQLFSTAETLKPYNMLLEEKPQPVQTGPVTLGMPQQDGEKKRLYGMVGIFVILIFALIGAFFYMNAENARLDAETAARNKTIREARRKASPTASVSATPTETIVASTSAAEKQALPLEIVVSSQRASISGQLQLRLRDSGYIPSIDVQGRIIAVPLVIFSTAVPQDVREEIISIVTFFDAGTTVQESTEEESGVIINF